MIVTNHTANQKALSAHANKLHDGTWGVLVDDGADHCAGHRGGFHQHRKIEICAHTTKLLSPPQPLKHPALIVGDNDAPIKDRSRLGCLFCMYR